MTTLRLPRVDGTLESYDLRAGRSWKRPTEPFRSRMSDDAYSQARRAVVRRRIREEHGLPEITV